MTKAVAASRLIKSAQSCAMSAPIRQTKITFEEMRAGGDLQVPGQRNACVLHA
jgi:hypothetical protein